MIQTYYEFLAASLIFFLLLGTFWPDYGLRSRWKRMIKQKNHSLLEQALKHIYECERSRKTCTMNSLAFTLFVKKVQVGKLLKQLKGSGLIIVESAGISLTRNGKEEALHILRLYRIFEGYLVHETITDESE